MKGISSLFSCYFKRVMMAYSEKYINEIVLVDWVQIR